MNPSLWTYLGQGIREVQNHGVQLLYWRFYVTRKILDTPPLPCPPESPTEVHMQVCRRDWAHSFWALKSFAHFSKGLFRLVLFLDGSLSPHQEAQLARHFPGAILCHNGVVKPEVTQTFSEIAPALLKLRSCPSYFTLPKIMDSYALRAHEQVLMIDPDVLFFDCPNELLEGLNKPGPYFARLNVSRKKADPVGSFCVDAAELESRFQWKYPSRFNTGLGIFNFSRCDWPAVDRVFRECKVDPARGFLVDQTVIVLQCLLNGVEYLDAVRYAVDPVADLSGTVARHYYAKTRSLLYIEGIPRLLKLGILER